jgi:hypothetical protein
MAERKKFPVVNFRSVEHLLGQVRAQNYDLADILLNFPRPFGISHAPGLRQGIDQYPMALWDGDEDVVYLGVNHNPYSEPTIHAPQGLFYLQRGIRRMLYDPLASIPLRDSYRGFYQNDFGTTAGLTDLVEMVIEKGVTIQQITSIYRIPGVKDFMTPQMVRHVRHDGSINHPYRIEGKLDLEAVRQQKLHEVRPFTSSQEVEALLNNHA